MSLADVYEFTYPPDSKLCQKHRLATRIWKGEFEQYQHNELCECCGRKVGQLDVASKCCYQSEQLSFLGVGLPLFFSFLRYSILLLFLIGLIFCVFGLYTNIVSKNCQNGQICASNIFNTVSIVNKQKQQSYLSVQNYILLTFVVLSMFIFQFFRYRFRKIVEDVDESVASPSDYSIILKRLPENTCERDIREMIEQRRGFLDEEEKIQTENLREEKIIMSYDLTELNKEKQKYLKEFKERIKQGNYEQNPRPELPQPSIPGFMAIVIFTRQQSKQLFISQPKCDQRFIHALCSPCSPLSCYRIKDERICVKRAPEPDDILWDNAHVTVCEGIMRKAVLGTVSFVLLMAGGFAQYGLAIMQRDIKDDNRRILVGTLASIVVAITNLILQYFLIYTTYWQRMNTVTKYVEVLNFKLVFQQFLNAGLFVVIANIAANQNFNIQRSLSQIIIQIMIINAITPNISTFVMYKFDISGKIMRYFCLQKKWTIYTQLQANQLYEKPQPILPEKYSYIIKTLWLTTFYAPFTPIVVPISILGLIFNYFVEKNLFGSAYSAPNMISMAMNQSCLDLFECIPLLMSLGEFLVYWYFKKFNFSQIPPNWSVPIWLSIGISFIQLMLPMGQLNKMICKIRYDLSNQPPYSQTERDFQVTYELTNPVYQAKKERQWDARISSQMRLKNSSKFNTKQQNKSLQMKDYNMGEMETDRQVQNPFMKTNNRYGR